MSQTASVSCTRAGAGGFPAREPCARSRERCCGRIGAKRRKERPLKQVRVVSTGSYLPGDPIDNETVARLAGPLPDDILEGLQVKTRHWAADPETGEHRESNSGMATKAAREALELADLTPEDVDLIV